MRQLFPTNTFVGQELLGIQVSFFECSGITIGVYSSHKIANARGRCTLAALLAGPPHQGGCRGLDLAHTNVLQPSVCEK
ncbi:hypothetical protein Sjap_023381 [Stephania japonica]|uniref:Uncharacterized protein n=1 Tax=Stephania japonica TaxID=461633 RepID=A0AAP0EJY4_9MAGN